jgi:divalent metal cation (Fe/Co/Zn/Cd) transporter
MSGSDRRSLITVVVALSANLGLALVLEGASFIQASRQVRREAEEHQLSVRGQLRGGDDPAPCAVFTEDLAAVIGILLAAGGVTLHWLTGSAVWDGVASMAIGVLLAVVAVLLAKTCMVLLIGRQADARMVRGSRPGSPSSPRWTPWWTC